MNLRPYQKAAARQVRVDLGLMPQSAADFANLIEGIGLNEDLADLATLLQDEPREATVDAIEARPAAAPAAMRITKIDTAALDNLLAPYIEHGLLRTAYHAATRATVYTSPLRRVIALSIGADHFCHADPAHNGSLEWVPHKWATAPAGHGAMSASALAQLLDHFQVPSVAGIPTPVRLTDPKAWDDVPAVAVSPALYVQQCGRSKRPPQPVQWVLKNPRTGEIIPGSEFTSARDWAESMLNREEPK